MKRYKYIGTFISAEGHKYELEVMCNGWIQALILLTADGIRTGQHYQLNDITDEKHQVKFVDDILQVGELLS